MSRRWVPWGALMLGAGVAVSAAADDLRTSIARLVRDTRYDVALADLDALQESQGPLPPDLAWQRARLLTDPDRFLESALAVRAAGDPADTLAQAITFEVAREQFARGQYTAALEALSTLPPAALRARPRALLFQGMAAATLGQLQVAHGALELVPLDCAAYGPAQVQLAGLSLRAGRHDEALGHADAALREQRRRVGPQAMYARVTALRELGRQDTAAETARELVREFGKSSEAAWVREAGLADSGQSTEDWAPAVPEVAAAPRRVDFSLQFGAFHDRALALRLALRLQKQTPDLRIERDDAATPPWYRVVGGRYPTRAAAEQAQTRARAAGFPAVVVSPGQAAP
jgi:tetratricopeptide (TPR) repeat protein